MARGGLQHRVVRVSKPFENASSRRIGGEALCLLVMESWRAVNRQILSLFGMGPGDVILVGRRTQSRYVNLRDRDQGTTKDTRRKQGAAM